MMIFPPNYDDITQARPGSLDQPGCSMLSRSCIFRTSLALSLRLKGDFPRGPGLAGARNVSILHFIGAKDD